MAGAPVGLLHDKRLVASPGVYTMTGKNVGLFFGHIPLVLEPGAFAMTGSALASHKTSVLKMDPGVYLINGKPIALKYSWFSGEASANYQFRKQRRIF